MGLLKLKVSEEEKNQKKSIEDLEETLRKLRLQKNQLIEIIQEKDQEIKKLRAKDEVLRNRVAGCQEQSPVGPVQHNGIGQVMHGIFLEMETREALVPYKNKSKNSQEFFKFRKDDFDAVLEELAESGQGKIFGFSTSEILRFMVHTSVMKIQGSGKHYWMDTQDGQRVKVLLIRKTAYEYFLREWDGA